MPLSAGLGRDPGKKAGGRAAIREEISKIERCPHGRSYQRGSNLLWT
jgi:hypothetical protein